MGKSLPLSKALLPWELDEKMFFNPRPPAVTPFPADEKCFDPLKPISGYAYAGQGLGQWGPKHVRLGIAESGNQGVGSAKKSWARPWGPQCSRVDVAWNVGGWRGSKAQGSEDQGGWGTGVAGRLVSDMGA